MKLLRKKDVPEYKVPLLIWSWTNFVRFKSSYAHALQLLLIRVLPFVFHRLNSFWLVQYTIAMLGYEEEDKTTVLELTYNYGVTEYSKGNAYAQVLYNLFFLHQFHYKIFGIFYDFCFFNCSLPLALKMCTRVLRLSNW